jgi:metal-responsive CopG/Arc/MetJ family transcriptional regulator
MKKRISSSIEEEVISEANQRAAQEGRSLSALIQDALVSFLSKKKTDPRTREKAYQFFCERPMRLSRKQFKEVLKKENFKPA